MTLRTSLLCLTFAISACTVEGDPATGTPGAPVEKVSHSQAALMVTTNTETALNGLANAAEFLTESATILSAMNELGGSSESCTTSALVCDGGGVCTGGEEVCETDELTPEEFADIHKEIKDGIAEVVDELKKRIFTEDNIESSTDTSVTYRLEGDDLCPDVVTETLNADGTYTESSSGPDPDCVAEVNDAQIRLRVTSPSDGNVDVTVILTGERYEPMVVELHKDRLAVTTDLDQLASSVQALGEDFEQLESLTGKVQVELVKTGQLQYAARNNVLEDVEVVIVDDEGDRFEFSLGASSPTTEVAIDAVAKTVSATLGYGPMRVAGPFSGFAKAFEDDSASGDDSGSIGPNGELIEEPAAPEKTYTGNIEAVLGGLDGTVTYSGKDDKFSFTNLGLGDIGSTLKHNGNTLVGLDVNAEQGRHFDLTVKDTNTGLEFTFSPTLDVSLLFALEHIADQVEVPSVLMNDTLRFFFDGANPSVRARDNGLEVTSGTLHLTSSSDPSYDVEVAAGMCLVGEDDVTTQTSDDTLDTGDALPVEQPVTEEVSEEEHPFSSLAAGACE